MNLNIIRLQDSGIEVNFSDVILSKQAEERKRIICKQKSKISIKLTDRLIEKTEYLFRTC